MLYYLESYSFDRTGQFNSFEYDSYYWLYTVVLWIVSRKCPTTLWRYDLIIIFLLWSHLKVSTICSVPILPFPTIGYNLSVHIFITHAVFHTVHSYFFRPTSTSISINILIKHSLHHHDFRSFLEVRLSNCLDMNIPNWIFCYKFYSNNHQSIKLLQFIKLKLVFIEN